MNKIIDAIVNGVYGFFGNNVYLTTFFISMLPMIEVRGAIPIAVKLGMNIVVASVFSALSALVVCPILIFALRPLLNKLKETKAFKKLASLVEEMFAKRAEKIESDASEESAEESGEKPKNKEKSTLYKAIGLFLFAAIPLPMTGVWTASAVASFIKLKFRYSFLAIVLGNFTSAAIISLLTYVLGDYSFIILIALAVFILISVSGILLAAAKKARKQK